MYYLPEQSTHSTDYFSMQNLLKILPRRSSGVISPVTSLKKCWV